VPVGDGFTATRPGTLTVSVTDPSGVSRVEYAVDGARIASAVGGGTYPAEWDIAAITDGPHGLAATAYDSYGNATTLQYAVTVALAPPPAPVITSPASGLVTKQTSVTVTGTAAADAQVLLYRNGAQVAGPLSLQNGQFTGVVALVEGANLLQAAGQNRGGIGPLSPAVTVTLDSGIPDPPLALFAEAREAGEVRLIWGAPPDDTVRGYDVYRSQSPFGDVSAAVRANPTRILSTSFIDLPPSDGTWYYRAVSVNAAGTSSEPSNQASAVSDREPPVATLIAYEPQGPYDPASGRFGVGEIAVTLHLSESALTTPFLTITPDGGVPAPIGLSAVDETTYRGRFEVVSSMPSGTAYAVFSARDAVGNRGTEILAGASIQIDTEGPAATGFSVQPADPIRNDAQNPVSVEVAFGISETLGGGQSPTLSYLLSGEGRQAQPVPLTSDGAGGWVGGFVLPADAGQTEAESLTFSFEAADDLGNRGTEIQGPSTFQVYQGDLEPLDVPAGLTAEALPGGEVRLSWQAVEGAADYQLYRALPGEAEPSEYQRTGNRTGLTDTTPQDGLYLYAIASVRQANGQEALSAPSAPVEVYADATPPDAPADVALTLTGSGIQIAWTAPVDEAELRYRVYRSETSIDAVEGLEPVLTDLSESPALDQHPDETDRYYTVTAVDPAGNESLPAPSAYLPFDLLPVADLQVIQQDDAFPEVTWSATGTAAAGYDIYLLDGGTRLQLNTALLTEPSYTDVGFTGGQRRYGVVPVDAQASEGPERQVLLPDVQVELSDEDLQRGIMNLLDYQVTNETDGALSGAELVVTVGGYAHRSLPFDLQAEETTSLSLVVGGQEDLPAVADLVTALEVSADTGERASLLRTSSVEVGESSLAVQILPESFTRGGAGQVRFSIYNSSEVQTEIVTARGQGGAASDEVRFLLTDADGNLLATESLHQAFGEGVVTLANGTTVARIAPSTTFTSDVVALVVPESAPDEVEVTLVIDSLHYHLGQEDAVSIGGLETRRTVSLIDVPYQGEVTTIAPTSSFGDQDILIEGRALQGGSTNPMPRVPLDLVISVDGFERVFELVTDENGAFRYSFEPLPGEAGIYSVCALHPDQLIRPIQGQFTIGRVIASPALVDLHMPRDYDQGIPITLTAGSGTTATNVRLLFEAADQPGGTLPAGIQLSLPPPVTLASGQSVNMTLGVRADNTASETGSFVVTVKSDESGSLALATISVNYRLGEAQPALHFKPGSIETGVARDGSVTETLTLENQGLATAEGVGLELRDTEGNPAPDWVFLSTSAEAQDLPVGEGRLASVTASPGQEVAEGIYDFRLRATSDNADPVGANVGVSVTQSGIGDALFHLSDIYTATLDDLGDPILGLAGATVRVQNEEVLTIDQTLTTDEAGEALFRDLPTGRYKFEASAPDHQSVIGTLSIKPGITVAQEVFLTNDLVTVEWSVTEIPLEDSYQIDLEAVYETDVPVAAAMVVMEPTSINLPDMEPGDVYYGEFTLTNYGLIQADDLKVSLGLDENYRVELLVDPPTTLAAKQRVTIPYRVVALGNLDQGGGGAGADDCTLRSLPVTVTYSYVCANGTVVSGTAVLYFLHAEGECSESDILLISGDLFIEISGPGDTEAGGTVPDTQPRPEPIGDDLCVDNPPRPEPDGDGCSERNKDKNFGTGSWVAGAMREYQDSVEDLRVKVPGGFVRVNRRYYDDAWRWDHERIRLLFTRDTATQKVVSIDRGEVIYTPVVTGDDSLFENESYRIAREGAGYRWEDVGGNWVSYDSDGRPVAYGSLAGEQGRWLYADAQAIRPSGMADRNGVQVLWLEYDANDNLALVRDAQARQVQYGYTGGLLTLVVDPIGGETHYQYNAAGQLISKLDPAGRTVSIAYDGRGEPVSVLHEDGTGKSFDFGYDSATKEHSVQVQTSTGKLTDVWYDRDGEVRRSMVNGRLMRTIEHDGRTDIITDEKGNVTRETHNEWDQITRVVYPDGSEVTYEYDPTFHRVTRAVDQRGTITDYSYDDSGNLIRMVEAAGTAAERATSYVYDQSNQLISVTREGDAQTAQAVTNYTYDPAGNIATITDAEGNTTAFLAYDVMGNVLHRRDARGQDWLYTYDDLGRLITETDPEGNTTTYEYDAVGNRTAVIDANQKRFEYQYDEHNRLVRTIDPYGHEQAIAYNADGLPILLTDEEGRTVRNDYDNEQRLLGTLVGTAAEGYETRYQYDEDPQNAASSSLPASIQYPTYTARLSYDPMQRLTRVTNVLDADTEYSVESAYDSAGNLIAATDEEDRTTGYVYDALDRLIEAQDPAGGVTRYAYDDRDNLIAVTDPNGGITRFEYDRNDRLTAEILPLGQTTSYEYDAAGNRAAVIDAKGQRIEYEYSPAGHLSGERHFSADDHQNPAKVVQYSYDALGRMTGYDDGTTSATYSYDDLGRETGVTIDYGPFALSHAYSYYANGLKESFTGPDGETYRYFYDEANRLSAIELPAGQRITYTGYRWNSPLGVVRPGGTTTAWDYDALQRLISIEGSDPVGNSIMSYQYSYSAAGNILTKQTEPGEYQYSYDLLDRLTDATSPVLDDEHYTYDLLGNRLTSADVAGEWQYDLNNRLFSYGDQTIEYDDNGNTTRKGSPGSWTSFVYNVADRLVRIEDEGGSIIANYYYDPFGQRLWKDVGGVRTYFAYSDEGLVGEFDTGGKALRGYGFSPNSFWAKDPLFQNADGMYFWYQNDHLGTPQTIVDSLGNPLWIHDYQAFGGGRTTDAIVENRFRLPGQYLDDETNLHYNFFRYYNPVTGRYLSQDPLGVLTKLKRAADAISGSQRFQFAGGLYDQNSQLMRLKAGDYYPKMGGVTAKNPILLASIDPNLYTYVHSNPINWVDTTGTLSVFGTAAATATILWGYTITVQQCLLLPAVRALIERTILGHLRRVNQDSGSPQPTPPDNHGFCPDIRLCTTGIVTLAGGILMFVFF
jgi:RHS repeat-associated protein